VASVNTLGRYNSKRYARHNWRDYGAIVVDECHHAAAETYKRLLLDFIGIKGKLVLGLTATPERSDKADLSDLFGCEPVYQL
jgi:superfamily II DNA or RNA helicase